MPTPQQAKQYYGTLEPFVSEAVYQVLTDRFVDGDPDNNYVDQGSTKPTWELKLDGPNGEVAYAGYTGGDFRGLHQYGDYIREMGFTAVCISPIVDNPDEAFTTDDPDYQVRYGQNIGIDGGKAGYHGYWGVNFYKVDEHLESPGFTFQDFTAAMQSEHDLKIVLDVVANHGSPAWSMIEDQPKFGKISNEDGVLIADHQNLRPSQLAPDNEPLHRFYNNRGANPPGEWDERKNLARLSDFNEDNPEVLDYLVNAYLKWIGQGAIAFRVDTIAWMPHAFWKKFSDAIREQHPGFFMYAEHFTGDTSRLAAHQRPENGAISVLDFAGSFTMKGIFENPGSDYNAIQGYLHLDDGTYVNPYELAIFYDNHDMPRMNASDVGFINANNWLFTTRGFPTVYYGSEMGFQRGLSEHHGNRNPYGPENIATARNHIIRQNLIKVAHLRKELPSLQRGLQVNLDFDQHIATFLRVYQLGDEAQTALVILNKGDHEQQVTVNRLLSTGGWIDAESGEVAFDLTEGSTSITAAVPAHGLKIYLLNETVNNANLIAILDDQMEVLAPSHALRENNAPSDNNLAITDEDNTMLDDNTNGLVGFWKFDENSGRIAHDSSGNENHGTIVPDESEFETWGNGEFADTLSFNRKDQNHLSIPASSSLNEITKTITVVANFYPRSFPTREELEENIYANYVSVVQRQWADATHPDLYYLGFGPGDEVHGPDGILEYKWHLGVRDPDGNDVMADLYVPDQSGTISPNQWMHMVGTYDGGIGLLCLYLNGTKIGEHTLVGEIRMDDPSRINPLVIACELNQGGHAVGNLDAYVDEVRVYNRALNEAEVQSLADSAKK